MELKMKDLMMGTAGLVTTENGALAHATTGSHVLNLFALGGVVRNKTVQFVTRLIHSAWLEDKELALKVIFHLGDVRGGQGERDFFSKALKYIAVYEPQIGSRLIELIPEYSRWDMLFAFIGTGLEDRALAFMKSQFLLDMRAENPSLLAKWLPSPSTKSQKELALKVARAFGMRLEVYRKERAKLNRKIKTVEVQMSSNDWDNINFEKVPAKAFMNYQNAFERHGYEKMKSFTQKILSGEVGVKSNTLYPHEIVKKYMRADGAGLETVTLQSAWDNLPNFLPEGAQGIAVVDTSGSMYGLPMLVAKSLGIYMAERLSGPYKNHYITFSSIPIMQELQGLTVLEKYQEMRGIVEYTNIESVFDLILETAVKHNIKQSELPTHLYILSDMQFDELEETYRTPREVETLMQTMKKRYEAEGYKMPQCIYWNLRGNNNYPVSQHESGAILMSGFSPATLKYMSSGEMATPYEAMLEVLNSPRYQKLSEIWA